MTTTWIEIDQIAAQRNQVDHPPACVRADLIEAVRETQLGRFVRTSVHEDWLPVAYDSVNDVLAAIGDVLEEEGALSTATAVLAEALQRCANLASDANQLSRTANDQAAQMLRHGERMLALDEARTAVSILDDDAQELASLRELDGHHRRLFDFMLEHHREALVAEGSGSSVVDVAIKVMTELAQAATDQAETPVGALAQALRTHWSSAILDAVGPLEYARRIVSLPRLLTQPAIYERSMGDLPTHSMVADVTRPLVVHLRLTDGWVELPRTTSKGLFGWDVFDTNPQAIERYGHILAGGQILRLGGLPGTTATTTNPEGDKTA